MKNAALLAVALLLSGVGMVQPSFAAAEEPAAAATEPMKTKPVKHKAPRHHHERHSSNLKAHKHNRAA